MSASRTNAIPPVESSDVAVWVVRGGRKGDTVVHNLEENVVTLAWGDWVTDVDAVEFADRDALDRIFQQRFDEEHSESVIRRSRQEILRFCDRTRIGDLVVLTLKKHETADMWIAIGKVAGPAILDQDQPEGARLRRKVNWLKRNVPESAVQPNLRLSIKRPRLTVFEPQTEDAARRILRIATHSEDPGLHSRQALALSGDEAGVESEDGHEIPEGAKTQVMVNRYERDPVAWRLCLEHVGYAECAV